MRTHPKAVVCLAFAIGFTAGCDRMHEQPTARPDWNVLFVLVDTLRADRMSLYGYGRETSPALERFAQRAIVFERALSQAGCTFPSVNSMLTSRYPVRFLQTRPRRLGIPDDTPSLATILRDAGYSTAAISSSQIVRHTPSARNPHGGFGTGFDRFDETCEMKGAACVNRSTLAAIDESPEPFFVYAHFLEPHAPYAPPRWHERRFATSAPAKRWVRLGTTTPIRDHLYHGAPERPYDAADIAHLSDLYDEEILHFDRQFELLLGELEDRDLLGRTIIVLASDHGEELLDHGEFAHCRDHAYNSILHTPLVIYLPSNERGGRRRALAANLDVVPTLLDYLAISRPDVDLEGESLRPVIEDDRPVRRYAFASQGTSRVVTDGEHKLLYDLESDRARLFDWRADPREERDVAEQRPEVTARLRSELFAWIERLEGAVGSPGSVESAHETERALEALGYL